MEVRSLCWSLRQRKDKPDQRASCPSVPAMAPRSNRDELHGLGSSTLPPSASCALGRSAKAPAFQAGEAGSISAGHFHSKIVKLIRGSANGRLPGFEPGGGGSNPSPRTSDRGCCLSKQIDPRQLLLVVTPGSEQEAGGSIPPLGTYSTEVIRPDEEPVLKTGVRCIGIVSSSLTASPLGSSSNRKTSAPQAGNPGATPGGSLTTNLGPVASGEGSTLTR